MKPINEVDHRYGRLTVLKYMEDMTGKHPGAYWLCQCSCGNKTIVRGIDLRCNNVRSCGCLCKDNIKIIPRRKPMNETGKRYGKLLVLDRVENDNHHTRWLCRCDCGNTITVGGWHLRSGNTRSCGCLRKRMEKGEAAFNALVSRIKWWARKRKLVWKLSQEYARWITSQPCYYCNIEPSQITWHKKYNGRYRYNGIDRVDNSLGYIPENCVPCCGHCNMAKGSSTQSEFKYWLERTYMHYCK